MKNILKLLYDSPSVWGIVIYGPDRFSGSRPKKYENLDHLMVSLTSPKSSGWRPSSKQPLKPIDHPPTKSPLRLPPGRAAGAGTSPEPGEALTD